MITNNYYYFLEDICEININDYILLYSIIKIQKPENLFIYHNNILKGKFKDNLINSELWIEFNVNIKFIYLKKINFEKILIEYLNEYGGIYIKKKIFIIRDLSSFLKHKYIKLEDILIGISKNNKIENLSIINNLEETFIINNNLIYNINDDYIYKKIIFDYNFSEYFNIIYNFYMIDLTYINENTKDIKIINNYLLDSKITIFNLIIYYILGYYYYFDDKLLNNINEFLINKINKVNKVYYINLERNADRNNNMIEILNNFNIEYKKIEGLDGRKINNIKDDYFCNSKNINYNSNAEYAVLYSHLSTIKQAMDKEGDYFLIFEDDCCLDFCKYWNESLDKIIEDAPDDWEIIMLGYFTLNLNFESKYRLWNNDWSALSYIIKKSSIVKINEYIINNKFKLFEDVNVADNYLFRIFKTYLYKYPLFTITNNNKSTFHNDHDQYQKIYKNINYLILNEIFDKYL